MSNIGTAKLQQRKRNPTAADLAAEAAGVSTRMIYYGKKVKARAIPELWQAVIEDRIKLHHAAKIAEAPHEQQLQLLGDLLQKPKRRANSEFSFIRTTAAALVDAIEANEADRAYELAAKLRDMAHWACEQLEESRTGASHE